jgi:hypothetical protein
MSRFWCPFQAIYQAIQTLSTRHSKILSRNMKRKSESLLNHENPKELGSCPRVHTLIYRSLLKGLTRTILKAEWIAS